MKLDYQDNIDRYLMGQMSDKECELFEAKCAEDQELKDQLEYTRKVRTVVSARSRILEKVQKWDEEYDAEEKAKEVKLRMTVARKKRLVLYWLSGIAAIFVVGFFFFPSILISEQDEFSNTVSMKQDNTIAVPNDSTFKNVSEKERENLLAKSDVGNKGTERTPMEAENDETNSNNQNHVSNVGNDNIIMASPTNMEGVKKKLEKVEVELQQIIVKVKQNEEQYASGTIDQDIYNTTMKLLKYQKDQLLWEKANILLAINRKSEALTILDEMRKTKGKYQNMSDSLYREIKD